MPLPPDRTSSRAVRTPSIRSGLISMLTALVLAGGCATPGPDPESPKPSAALQSIALSLPGRYVSVAHERTAPPHLSIQPGPSSDQETLSLILTQTDPEDGAVRRFALRLEPTASELRLAGEITPLHADGGGRLSCPMSFHLRERGLVGTTDPRTCRFGEGAEATGLLKEMVFDGRRLTIGDRLVSLTDGSSPVRDEVLDFLPVLRFSGWAGKREGEAWRIGHDIDIVTGGRSTTPRDAAGMALGIVLRLDYYRLKAGSGEILLRLTVSDDEGSVLTEAWSDPRSRSIGVALPDLQVGLRLEDQP